ncbi:MAG: RNA methyltransferase [Muribaculaceae bacterium]|nr:RNA methyltransferase [Muribaculaceae bacterium]
MNDNFEMVAKTFQGLEEVLAEELRNLGAENVIPGKRMVAFEGNKELLYKANLCCRTALRILKPFYKFSAKDADSLYEQAKEYDWSQLLTIDKTFQIDTVAYSDEFSHSRFVTYRIKDAIVDWFKDRYGADKRPGVRLVDADVMINVHISGTDVTLSLDSSGESLHKRGYRVAQTEAPINEVLAAGILLRSGYRGDCPLVDPMCGSGTFLIEAAMIAANINPGIYRRGFAFERWKDFDADLFDSIFNDDSAEREPAYPICGADISPKAIDIARENIKSAGMAKYITLEVKPISRWEEAPLPAGILVTNPPYGERISAPDMDALYATIGNRLKNVFQGYHAWIIGYRDEYFAKIGLAASEKVPVLNGALECELREYVIFEGDKKSFLKAGGKLKNHDTEQADRTHKKNNKERRFRDSDERNERRFKDSKERKFRDRDSISGDRKFKDRDARRHDDRHRKSVDRSDRYNSTEIQADSDNPLALRRNPYALRSIQGKAPSLPKQDGPIMRSRGWKKK